MHSSGSSLVALVGAPNCGKTTLYNWLTGSKFKTVNYPGATVDYAIGHLADHWKQPTVSVLDTPGTYSLFPKSEDEQVTYDVLFGEKVPTGIVKKVILVIDATQMERHLLLFEQLKASGFSIVVALTMVDILKRAGLAINLQKLETQLGVPVQVVDGLLGKGIPELIAAMFEAPLSEKVQVVAKWSLVDYDHQQKRVRALVAEVLSAPGGREKVLATTKKIDRIALHPFFGILTFFLIMTGLFTSIFWLATPFMDWFDASISWGADQAHAFAGEGLLGEFLSEGLIKSFGAVLIFVPQIFILFFGIGILESSGYLARAATLIDRPFSSLGMSGRSFVPVLSGFACAVPAMMATRNIPSKRDRMITLFMIPLLTCSARIPVFALFLAFIFVDAPAWQAGLGMAALYFVSLIVGTLAAAIINRFLPAEPHGSFMMELPLYRRPRFRVLLQQSLTRTKSYATRAGPVIFVLAVVLWLGTTFPHQELSVSEGRLQKSYFGQMGHYIEPVFEPMGVDWRVGVSLLTSFAAREVFVASLALTMDITDDNEETMTDSLLAQMRTAQFSDGRMIFTTSTVMGLLAFVLIALQCIATTGVAIREMGSWKFAIFQLLIFNIVAYVVAVGIVQGLRAFGVS